MGLLENNNSLPREFSVFLLPVITSATPSIVAGDRLVTITEAPSVEIGR
jgi:hypothetical protein